MDGYETKGIKQIFALCKSSARISYFLINLFYFIKNWKDDYATSIYNFCRCVEILKNNFILQTIKLSIML